MEKLNRAQKCSILGPQNLGSRGPPGPRGQPGSAPDNNETCSITNRIPKMPHVTAFNRRTIEIP